MEIIFRRQRLGTGFKWSVLLSNFTYFTRFSFEFNLLITSFLASQSVGMARSCQYNVLLSRDWCRNSCGLISASFSWYLIPHQGWSSWLCSLCWYCYLNYKIATPRWLVAQSVDDGLPSIRRDSNLKRKKYSSIYPFLPSSLLRDLPQRSCYASRRTHRKRLLMLTLHWPVHSLCPCALKILWT